MTIETSDETESWLLTGGTGFIGQHFVSAYCREYLQRTPDEQRRMPTLICLARSTSDQLLMLMRRARELGRLGRFDIRFANLSDLAELRACIPSSITVAIHCAAQGGDWGHDDVFMQSNQLGTENLCTAIKENCPGFRRFVHVSTIDVYPHSVSPADCHEDVEPVTASHYGYSRTKAAAERIVRDAAFPEWTIMRVGVVLGPGSFSWGLTESRLLLQRRGLLVSGGCFTSAIVDVNDVVDALFRAARAPAELVHQQSFNIANPEHSGTWRDYYDLLAEGLGCPKPRRSLPLWVMTIIAWLLETLYRIMGWYDDRPLFTFFLLRLIGQPQLWPVDRAAQQLDWRPTTPLRTSVERSIPWIKKQLDSNSTVPF